MIKSDSRWRPRKCHEKVTQKIHHPAFAFSAYLLKVPSNTLAGEKFTHIVRVRPIGHALKKITEITIDKSCRNDAAGALMTQKSPISRHRDVGDKNACLKK